MTVGSTWPVPPPRPRASPEAVHVWRVDLERDAAAVQDLRQSLAQDERARADRFRFPRHRRRFTVARGALRAILSLYLDLPPAEIAFRYERLGKPLLAEGGLHFNLSHSADVALVAVTGAAAVGVDVEQVRDRPTLERMAERFFAAPEVAALRQLEAAERVTGFFHCWTRKEAVLKVDGRGLAFPLDQIEVSLDVPARLLKLHADAEPAGPWSLWHLEPVPGYVAALSLAAQPVEVTTWAWRAE